MTAVMVHIEMRAGMVQAHSLEVLSAGRYLADLIGASLAAVVAEQKQEHEPLSSSLSVADELIVLRSPRLRDYTPSAHLEALAAFIKDRQPAVVLLAYSAVGLDLGPGLAHRTNREFVASCRALAPAENGLTVETPLYGGRFNATVELPYPAILTIAPGAFPEADSRKNLSTVTSVDVPPDGLDEMTAVGEDIPDRSADSLTQARKIVSVGRGIGRADGIDSVWELARVLNAELACSRPIVDSGWLSKDRQVGKSGTRVKPKLYLALGISGAAEHLEGIAGAELVVAVNNDESAPIFSVAQYGAICDISALVPELMAQLKHRES